MAIKGVFVAYSDARTSKIERIFSKVARSPEETQKACKRKPACFVSRDGSIAELSRQLGKIGRIREYNVV